MLKSEKRSRKWLYICSTIERDIVEKGMDVSPESLDDAIEAVRNWKDEDGCGLLRGGLGEEVTLEQASKYG